MREYGFKKGRMFTNTSFANSGRIAGDGILHDYYGDGGDDGVVTGGVKNIRFPHDNLKPEELNGECVIVRKGRQP